MGAYAQIPRRLLSDSIEVRPLAAGRLGEPVEVRNVCVQLAASLSEDAHRSADAGEGVVFLDAVHTVPLLDVLPGSRVLFGGASLVVAKVERLYTAAGRLHHVEWEVR